MRSIKIIFAAFAVLMCGVLPASAQSSWYYCDASRAYYPYVSSCAVPWREVPSTPQSSSQEIRQALKDNSTATPPEIKNETDADQQKIGDARALTAQQWAFDTNLIVQIVVGYECNIVDNLSANVAVTSIGNAMVEFQIQNGLNGDTTMIALQEVKKAAKQGHDLAEGQPNRSEFCSKFFPDPANRERLRQIVAGLMH